ncbi:hypothetical protein [Methanoregula sp.]|uniref:hypothetical protein n=1 Tax=Methanoregula sp. TaxID=2052170 RepID=UPI00236AFC56|nr:hypothetical protein [Methanoregula sp.]MDD1685581.1 hypothetical protein [Methanoregula sp.]
MDSEEIDEICEDLLSFNQSIDSQIELYQSKIAACQNMRNNPDFSSNVLLTHGDSERTEIKSTDIRRYVWPFFFVFVGSIALIISIISLSEGAASLTTPGVSIPTVEAAIAASLAIYGAGIAVLLFGADLILQTKTDIRDEVTNKKMFKELEKIVVQNRKLIDLLERNKEP